MSSRKSIATRFLTEVLGGGRFDLLDELVSANYADRSLPSGVTPRTAIEAFRAGFPDTTVHVEHQVEEGDTVVSRWTIEASHTGDFFGVPPTGRRISLAGFSEYRFCEDKMAESWVTYDQLGLMQQLGVAAGGPN